MADHRILSILFTAIHLRHLAWFGWTKTLAASIALLENEKRLAKGSRISDVFETAFDTLMEKYPIEYVYKTCILKKTIFGRNSPKTTAMYMEFPIAGARADMLLVNGKERVYEIKTKFDGPERINAQLEEYYRCFTYVTVVVAETQVKDYIQRLPDHVGISTLTSRFALSERRKPTHMIDKLNHASMFGIMRQKERYNTVLDLGLDLRSADPIQRYDLALDCFKSLPVQKAHEQVITTLRERQRTERLAEFCARLPQSLYVSPFAYRMRKNDWEGLIETLNQSYTPQPQPRRHYVFSVPQMERI